MPVYNLEPFTVSTFKLLYLVAQNIVKKWTMPVQKWKAGIATVRAHPPGIPAQGRCSGCVSVQPIPRSCPIRLPELPGVYRFTGSRLNDLLDIPTKRAPYSSTISTH